MESNMAFKKKTIVKKSRDVKRPQRNHKKAVR